MINKMAEVNRIALFVRRYLLQLRKKMTLKKWATVSSLNDILAK